MRKFVILALLAVCISSALASTYVVISDRFDAGLYQDIGDELLARGDELGAIAAYEKGLALEDDEETRSNLAVLYHGLEDYDNAIVHLERLVVSHPEDPSYNYDLAVNLVARFRTSGTDISQLTRAVELFEKSQELEPGYSHASENIDVIRTVLSLSVGFDDHP